MENSPKRKYSVQLSFEEIKLPPFNDILLLGRKCPQGRIGVSKSFDYLIPNEFEAFEIDDKCVETVFINKRLLKKIDKETIFSLLEENVYPFVSESEILKVDLKVKITYESIELVIDKNYEY